MLMLGMSESLMLHYITIFIIIISRTKQNPHNHSKLNTELKRCESLIHSQNKKY